MKKIILPIAIVVLFVLSCKKVELDEAPRLFRPVISGQLLADSNTIVASWQKVGGAKSYVLQLSRDTFKTISLNLPTDTNLVVIKNLLFNQLYQLQVRAIAPDTARSSRWSSLGAIKTLTSILKIPAVSDITFNSVRVSWTTSGAPVTSVKIVKATDNAVAAQVNLTALDVTNAYRVIPGLAVDTKYIIYLYSGTNERGFVEFITKPPFTGSVIDLTGITGRPSVLSDTLPTIASGSTVLLKRGQTYNIASAINLSKSVIITSLPDLSIPEQAKIYFTSNFNFAANAVIDSIEFNDVYMYSDNWGGRYIFNTTNSATVGKIKFMNSRVEIFRGVLRLQSGTATVNNFIIHNSLVDSIKDYGILTVGTTTTKVDNISLTNSTVYKCEKIISSNQASNAVLVDLCTFNDAPSGNSTYIEYNALNVTAGITVTNCIFGAGRANGTNFSVRDVRAGVATIITSSNNHRTSDHVSIGSNDLPNIATYNRASTLLWLDPANGNFKINDATFPARFTSGDPRWKP